VRSFNEDTRRDYVRHVRSFAVFIGRSPDTATAEELRLFQLHSCDVVAALRRRATDRNRLVGAARIRFEAEPRADPRLR
jgi:hypothetical protein